MLVLVAGLLLFFAAHAVRIYAGAWRDAQLARLGEPRWKGFYTLVSLAGLGLLVWGFGMARADPWVLWVPPAWTHHLAALLTLIAFILLAAAYLPGTRIKAVLGHPMVAGVKVWALAHLLANGTLADVLLFGSFLIWAVAAFAAARRRDRQSGVRAPAGTAGRDVLAVGVGALAWAGFALYGHAWLIGVKPLG